MRTFILLTTMILIQTGMLTAGNRLIDPPRDLALRDGQWEQTVTLPDGLFELTVEARGQGQLLLRATGLGERTQSLSPEGGTYGYLFEATAGETKIVVGVTGAATVTGAALLPATVEQEAAWRKQKQSLEQLGWAAYSAQRPTPGSAALRFDGETQPLDAMIRRAVLDEPRLNTHHSHNLPRLLQFLGDNGFARLDGDQIAAWMAARIKADDAYGSVVVLANGKTPATLVSDNPKNPLWVRYLRAGGRIVHIADVPFLHLESPSVEPVKGGLEVTDRGGLRLIGMDFGWHTPYWGRTVAAAPTPAAQAWGFEIIDPTITGFPEGDVSLAFGLFDVPANGKRGASSWFKNLRPDRPWSGLIKMLQAFDANHDAQLRDAWRAAHYVGQPVEIPALPPPLTPPPAPAVGVTTIAGGMTNRREFVRGERVEIRVDAPTAKVELVVPPSGRKVELRPKGGTKHFELDTAPYAPGEYQLVVTALTNGVAAGTHTVTVGIRHLAPREFHWEVWHAAGPNPIRSNLEFADIAAAGLELHLAHISPENVDLCVRHGMGFSLRAEWHNQLRSELTYEKYPEYYRHGPDGKPIGTAYSGGRPEIGLSHPEVQLAAGKDIERAVAAVGAHPAFRPYVLCNDDFSVMYGWDYTAPVLDRFKAETGRDAPRAMIKPNKVGAIPDDQPWVQWFDWTLRNVNAAYNKAQTDGARRARSDVRIGPIPGGMQIPLVMLWEPAQYPPYHFGADGFNLIASYYYNSWWQPIMTTTFWMEIGRMGNRDLPEWNLGDVIYTGGYTRNNFYHYLAGGVHGLAYFTYGTRTPGAWEEIRRLTPVMRRIGPVQARLKPARRDIGLLNSFTSNCFDPGHTLVQVYAYHNLMQGHFDVEPVSEDEVLAGRAPRYKAMLLYNVQYLRQSVYEALAQHAANGGLVILDRTIPFDIPGAKRINVDIGMGTESTKPFPAEGAHASTPGIRDYGHADRIAVIARALAPHVPPRFHSDDIHLVASRFEADGVPYTWFVNAHDGEEYMFCRERFGAGHPGAGTAEKIKELVDWENAEMTKPFVTTIEYDQLPGIPYDLVRGGKLSTRKTRDGRHAVTVEMDRFGGTLVAWPPTPLGKLRLDGPLRATPLTPVRATATLSDGAGVLPVEFVLRDPRGNVSVVSGVRGAVDGSATFEWLPAVNDQSGRWQLTARDVTTGRAATRAIRLESNR
jgi:hypothetical protein